MVNFIEKIKLTKMNIKMEIESVLNTLQKICIITHYISISQIERKSGSS